MRIGKRLAAVAMLAAGVGMISGCDAKEEKNPVIKTGVVNIGPASDFPAGAANTNFLQRYGIVIVNSGGTPLAVLPECTHDGATLKWDSAIDQFVCPAHGCRYDMLGRVTKGPATKDLAGIVPERQADGTLMVDLTKLYAMAGPRAVDESRQREGRGGR